MKCKSSLLIIVTVVYYTGAIAWVDAQVRQDAGGGVSARGRHTNNYAVIVDTSRYWFNYRHIANALSIYHTVKRAGIPDSQIILMLADDMACNPRNSFAAQVFNDRSHELDLYGSDVQVDFRGTDVNVENFLRVLMGRQSSDVPKNRRLMTDDRSNVLIFMSGHGGEEFLKFQDQEEISSQDLADSFNQMYIQKRYNEILFIVDTCQAASLHKRFEAPNIVSIGSSKVGENSYSHHTDDEVGVSVIDRFTYYALDFLDRGLAAAREQPSLLNFFNSFDPSKLRSNSEYRSDLFKRKLSEVPIGDFFSATTTIHITPYAYPLAKRESSVNKASPKEVKVNANFRSKFRYDPTHLRFVPGQSSKLVAEVDAEASWQIGAGLAAVAAFIWILDRLSA